MSGWIDVADGWAEWFSSRKKAGMGSFWLPPEIEREMPTPYICGVVSPCGPNGEPIACGWKPTHDGPHSWASLPSPEFHAAAIADLEEAGLDISGLLVRAEAHNEDLRVAIRAVIEATDRSFRAWDEDGENVSVGAVLYAIGVPLHALRALVTDEET